jgi:hypothetical protein
VAVDPQFLGLSTFAFPDVTGPGADVADPGYFTLAGFALPWAGMEEAAAVVPIRDGDLEWDDDDADAALQWDGGSATLTWE